GAGQRSDLRCCIWLFAKAVGADRRQGGYLGLLRRCSGILGCGAAGNPAKPSESDDSENNRTTNGTPQVGANILRYLHRMSFRGRSATLRSACAVLRTRRLGAEKGRANLASLPREPHFIGR